MCPKNPPPFQTDENKQSQISKQIPRRFQASTLDKLTYLLLNVGDQLIHCVLSFNGRLDEERIVKAVRLSFDAEPVLGCRFVKHSRKPYWERRDDLDQIKLCSFVETTDIEEELSKFIISPLDPTKEPPVQIRIFRSKTDILCLKVSHVVMDGAGIQEYLFLLASIYRELVVDPTYEVKPNIKGSRSLQQVLKHFNFLKKFRVFLRNRSPKPTWAFPWGGSEATKKNFAIHRFSAERFQKIKDYGRKRQATINDMLLTAYYRAMFKLVNPEPGVPMVSVVTVNLRPLIPSGKAESICNLSASIYPAIPWNLNAAFDETLSLVREQMNAKKADYPGLGPAFFLENFSRLRFSRMKKVTLREIEKYLKARITHPVFTNVGIINSKQLDFGEVKIVDSYYVTPITFAPGFIIGITTFEKVMTLSIGFCEGSYEKDVIEYFLSLIDKELP